MRLNVELERFGSIRRGEVGEHARKLKRPMKPDAHHERHNLVVAHADAVHPAVHRQMKRCLHAVRIGHLSVLDGELGLVHRRHDVVSQKKGDSAGRWLRQHENRSADLSFSKLDALGYGCHAQVIGSGGKRRLRNLYGTVPVSVGLHDGQQMSRTRNELARLAHVMANCA